MTGKYGIVANVLETDRVLPVFLGDKTEMSVMAENMEAQAEQERLKHPNRRDAVVGNPAPVEREKLWDADPNCQHNIEGALGGGVKCTKCSGWFCY